jgi:hypothetical protein
MVGAVAGAGGSFPGGLGILPGAPGLFELDALSYGRDVGDELLFSVDEFAIGVAGAAPDVGSEGAAGTQEASADVFTYLGPVVATPPSPSLGNALWNDGDGLPSPIPPKKGYGLVDLNPPTPNLVPDGGDNLDAVDIDARKTDFPGPPIFFSMDSAFPDPLEAPFANTGTAVANGFSGADVVVSAAGGAPAIAIPAATMGLDLGGFDTDDLDALVFDDADGNWAYTAGETLLFSVRRGSAVIGVADSCFGVPIEEGDVLTVPAGPGLPPCIFIAAEALGLATGRSGTAGPNGPDDLDALDLVPRHVVPAHPTWVLAPLAALLLSAGLWLAQRREQRRA